MATHAVPGLSVGANYWELLTAGGWVAGAILAVSVVLVALGIHLAVNYRLGVLCPEELAVQVLGLLRRDARSARRLLEEDGCPLARVLLAGLDAAEAPDALQPRDAMGEAGAQQATLLNHRVAWVGLIAAVAPMLGFLGTVAGMIEAFAELNVAGVSAQPELAGAISKALITTYLGLVVGIVALTTHRFFQNRVHRVLLGVGAWAEQAVPLLQRVRKEADHAPAGH